MSSWILLMWLAVIPMGNDNCYYGSTVGDSVMTHKEFHEWTTKEACEYDLAEQEKYYKKICKIDDKRWNPIFLCMEVPKKP